MILDMKGCISTTVHLICISNQNINLYLKVHPKLVWTDNISFARTFETVEEAFEFVELPIIRDFLENELEKYIWTDTKQSIF